MNGANEALVRQTIDGAIVVTARNTVHTKNDPTAHAETSAAEELAKLAAGSFLVPCRDLFARATDAVIVVGGVWNRHIE